jgi:hypothetical protein
MLRDRKCVSWWGDDTFACTLKESNVGDANAKAQLSIDGTLQLHCAMSAAFMVCAYLFDCPRQRYEKVLHASDETEFDD